MRCGQADYVSMYRVFRESGVNKQVSKQNNCGCRHQSGRRFSITISRHGNVGDGFGCVFGGFDRRIEIWLT